MITRRTALRSAAAGAAALGTPFLGTPFLGTPFLGIRPARAEATAVRLSHGFGVHYLPMMVIRDRMLLEKQAARLGLGPLTTSWRTLDGGSTINDAMLSGSLDIAGTGAPGFITLWAKARTIPASSVTGVCALGDGSQWLNSNNPAVKGLRDLKETDKIAVPGIKTSYSAVVLQMAVAHEFGIDEYARLDPITVSLPHPEAVAALTSGRTEVTAHMSSPPFCTQELEHPNVHRVLSTLDFLGALTVDVVYAPTRFTEANPALMRAFLAAKDEADQFIAANKDEAAAILARVSGARASTAAIRTLLDDPETTFTASPNGVMRYVEFMAHAKLIRTVPKDWRELFIAPLHDRQGS